MSSEKPASLVLVCSQGDCLEDNIPVSLMKVKKNGVICTHVLKMVLEYVYGLFLKQCIKQSIQMFKR